MPGIADYLRYGQDLAGNVGDFYGDVASGSMRGDGIRNIQALLGQSPQFRELQGGVAKGLEIHKLKPEMQQQRQMAEELRRRKKPEG